MDGVLQAYRNAVPYLALSGPTNFAPILRRVSEFAATVDAGENYFILLMITDGIITDMDQTIEVLRQAASLPLSVVIVGVGAADFSNMNVLDDDDGRLGLPRDLVQFVPFRKFAGVPLAELAKETLREIPKQLVQYMNGRGVKPQTPPPSIVMPMNVSAVNLGPPQVIPQMNVAQPQVNMNTALPQVPQVNVAPPVQSPIPTASATAPPLYD